MAFIRQLLPIKFKPFFCFAPASLYQSGNLIQFSEFAALSAAAEVHLQSTLCWFRLKTLCTVQRPNNLLSLLHRYTLSSCQPNNPTHPGAQLQCSTIRLNLCLQSALSTNFYCWARCHTQCTSSSAMELWGLLPMTLESEHLLDTSHSNIFASPCLRAHRTFHSFTAKNTFFCDQITCQPTWRW